MAHDLEQLRAQQHGLCLVIELCFAKFRKQNCVSGIFVKASLESWPKVEQEHYFCHVNLAVVGGDPTCFHMQVYKLEATT